MAGWQPPSFGTFLMPSWMGECPTPRRLPRTGSKKRGRAHPCNLFTHSAPWWARTRSLASPGNERCFFAPVPSRAGVSIRKVHQPTCQKHTDTLISKRRKGYPFIDDLGCRVSTWKSGDWVGADVPVGRKGRIRNPPRTLYRALSHSSPNQRSQSAWNNLRSTAWHLGFPLNWPCIAAP